MQRMPVSEGEEEGSNQREYGKGYQTERWAVSEKEEWCTKVGEGDTKVGEGDTKVGDGDTKVGEGVTRMVVRVPVKGRKLNREDIGEEERESKMRKGYQNE
ncbi:hypothetical protein Pmani_012882 [Petrolisthes manimaculis]|uniref:Uncharacterized protein n=1 Tax=Petrolisthes manimaculis TaxID=1843537 RepID=A0AAE1UCS2_9EUCA|nr:hypothetical protein Pmani_012882 [Petrolisthes manimaculis]